MSSPRVERHDLLVELGTEELPPKALSAMSTAFAEGLRNGLTGAGISIGAVEAFATPRRLAVLVRRVAARQPEQRVRRRGPPVSVAFDAQGAPTRAATAFAASCAMELSSLGRERDARGTEYLAYEGTRSGQTTAELLPALVRSALDALPIPKRMHWGALTELFVRPVHWLVLLFGRQVVPATMLGVTSGAMTRGHRFMAPKALRLTSPGSYAQTLLTRGKVVARFETRRDEIHAQITSLAQKLGGRAIVDPALLDEVTALVEWPVALAGRFEERFLALPREVLLSTLQAHQRYFALVDAQGRLLPQFITIANIASPQPELVRAGNERVVRPRLADAAFFWEQDRRTPLAARRAGLDAVSFQAQLGSLGARTTRIAALARTIAAHIGADAAHTARAAELAKCDLLSAMVGEFPELQGTMGRYYALADGEPAEVAEAIAEHYRPRGAGDALPASRVGDAVALADKIDLLAGIFAIGQRPSGTRDPFALRRAAIGVLRILLEHRLELDLPMLLRQAFNAQPLQGLQARSETLTQELQSYILERLRAQYLERSADSGISTEMIDAVLASRPRSVLDIDARLRALVSFLGRAESASLIAANKRTANILRKSGVSEAAAPIDVALLREPAERALAEAMQGLRGDVLSATERRDYAAALDRLASLRPAVDAFFDQVLVNDADPALRANRLALLGELRTLFVGIADLSCLPG